MSIPFILILSISLIFGLFFVLAYGADLLLNNLRIVADRSKIHPVLLGTLLGFLTTIPEFTVGINSIRQGIPSLSLGNVWGGVIVILSLILGLSIVLQREIKTDGRLIVIIPSFIFIILSMLLGLKGYLGKTDGLLLLACYIILIYFDYSSNNIYRSEEKIAKKLKRRKISIFKRIKRKIFFWRQSLKKEAPWIIFGIFLVSLSSYLILELVSLILKIKPVHPFLVGLLIFGLGTNLPEIVVMFKSLKIKRGDLSFGHLVGSAVSNILVLSLISFLAPQRLEMEGNHLYLLSIVVLVLLSISVFYVTSKKFSRWEGVFLLLLYLAFVSGELLFS